MSAIDEVKCLDIYICRIPPTHRDIDDATQTEHYCLEKYWSYLLGVQPQYVEQGTTAEEWAQQKANELNRHVAIRFHYDKGWILAVFSPFD